MKIFASTHPFGESNSEPRRIIQERGIELECNPYGRKIRHEELIRHIKDKDVLIAGTERLDESVLDVAPELKLIARVGIGIDGIDFEVARRRRIMVTYTPDAVTNAVAEMTVGNMISLARHIPAIDKGMHQGKWQRPIGFELRGKKIGIIGFGRIGQAVAKLLQGFSCTLYANDISPDEEISSRYNVHFVGKNFIFRECDIITLHIPETPLTRRLVNEDALARMKKDALVINTSRGGIIDENDLYGALSRGVLGGAALDVYETEPYLKGKLCGLNNVILTCHSGSCSHEARYLMEMGAAREAVAFYEGNPPITPVPEEIVIAERAETVVPINAEWHELSNTSDVRSDGPYKTYRRRWGQHPAYFIVGPCPLNIDMEIVKRHDMVGPLSIDYVTKPVEKSYLSFMEMGIFKKIMLEISTYREPMAVKFGFRGDPLLHPELCDMIKLAEDAGVVETIVSTHASETLIRNIDPLVDSGLSVLTLYVDLVREGGNPSACEEVRTHFLCDALDRIKRQKMIRGSSKPNIRLVAEACPEDTANIRRFKGFWRHWADTVAVTDKMQEVDVVKNVYPWACSKLWQRLVVTAEGYLLPCNYDTREKASLGCFPNESVKGAWLGTLLSDMRKQHMQNRSDEVKLCSACVFRKNEIQKMRQDADERGFSG